MSYIQFALALFKLVSAVMSYLQEQRWYQTGRDAANAEANEEQRKRIEEARAAAADAADVNSLHDPRNRDNR